MTLTPLRVRAHLEYPCVPGDGRQPIMLDGPLLAGMGYTLGALAGERLSVEDVLLHPLPLARVEWEGFWWYACSAAIPAGPEALTHVHRRPPIPAYRQLTGKGSINVKAGNDTMRRKPVYYRPGWMEIAWTCIGDEAHVRALLQACPGVGKMVTHGHGMVKRWEVMPDPDGPTLADYSRLVALRPLPYDMPGLVYPDGDITVTTRRMPLSSPYYDRTRATECVVCMEA